MRKKKDDYENTCENSRQTTEQPRRVRTTRPRKERESIGVHAGRRGARLTADGGVRGRLATGRRHSRANHAGFGRHRLRTPSTGGPSRRHHRRRYYF